MAKKAAKAARRGAPARAAAQSNRVTPDETMQVPSAQALASIIRAVTNAERDKNEATGRIGQIVSEAVEKKRLDKKAFSIFRGLSRMSDAKLATTLAHLEHYIEVGGLNERASSQGDMVGHAEVEEVEQEDVATVEARNGRGRKRKGSFAERFKNAGIEDAELSSREQGAEELRDENDAVH